LPLSPQPQEHVAAAFPVYVAASDAHVRHEVEASFMDYFRTVSEQLRLAERDQSASYAYLREVRRRSVQRSSRTRKSLGRS
jgi:hypothetical protein